MCSELALSQGGVRKRRLGINDWVVDKSIEFLIVVDEFICQYFWNFGTGLGKLIYGSANRRPVLVSEHVVTGIFGWGGGNVKVSVYH